MSATGEIEMGAAVLVLIGVAFCIGILMRASRDRKLGEDAQEEARVLLRKVEHERKNLENLKQAERELQAFRAYNPPIHPRPSMTMPARSTRRETLVTESDNTLLYAGIAAAALASSPPAAASPERFHGGMGGSFGGAGSSSNWDSCRPSDSGSSSSDSGGSCSSDSGSSSSSGSD